MRLAGPLTLVPEGRGQREAWTPGSDGRGAGGLEFEFSGGKELGIQIDGLGRDGSPASWVPRGRASAGLDPWV